MRFREYLKLMRDRDNPLARRHRRRHFIVRLVLGVSALVALWMIAAEAQWNSAPVVTICSLVAAPISGLATLLLLARGPSDEVLQELLLTRLSREEVVAGYARSLSMSYCVPFVLWSAGSLAGAVWWLEHETSQIDWRIIPAYGCTVAGMVGFWAGSWAVLLRWWLLRPGASLLLLFGGMIEICYYACITAIASIAAFATVQQAFDYDVQFREPLAFAAASAMLVAFPLAKCRSVLSTAPALLFRRVDADRSAREYWFAAESWRVRAWLDAIVGMWRWDAAMRRAVLQTLVIVLLCGIAATAALHPHFGNGSQWAQRSAQAPGVFGRLAINLARVWSLMALAVILPAMYARASISLVEGRLAPSLLRLSLQMSLATAPAAAAIALRESGYEGLDGLTSIFAIWGLCSVATAAILATLLPARGRKWKVLGWAAFAIVTYFVMTAASARGDARPLPSISSLGERWNGLLAIIGAHLLGSSLNGLQRYHLERMAQTEGAR